MLPDRGPESQGGCPSSPSRPGSGGPFCLAIALAHSFRKHGLHATLPTLPGGPLPPPPSGSRKARPAAAPGNVGTASPSEPTPHLPLSTPLGGGGERYQFD